MDSQEIKWGVIGPGYIAGRFVKDIALAEHAVLHAVASRDLERARSFATAQGAARYYDSYKQMIEDGEVDIIYIATPNSLHKQQTIDCLNGSIPVLCEKPASLNKSEVNDMVEASERRQTFFMEALWTRFNPAILKALQIIKSGELGLVQKVEAAFCYKAHDDIESALYMPEMGGGSILDIGIYPVFLSYLLLGQPKDILATATLSSTGIDQTCTMKFSYEGGEKASLYSTLMVDREEAAHITLTKGEIFVEPLWYNARTLKVVRPGGETEVIPCFHEGEGFIFEILECHRCLKNGWHESPLWTHGDSLNIAGILDKIRAQVGVRFPVD